MYLCWMPQVISPAGLPDAAFSTPVRSCQCRSVVWNAGMIMTLTFLSDSGGVPGSTITGKPTSSKKSKSIQTGLTAESTRAHSPSPRSQTTTYTEMLKSVENVGTTCTQDYKLRYHTPDLVDSYTQENIHYGFSSHDIHGGIYTETTHSNPASTVSTISDSPGSQISTMAFAGVYHQPDLDRYMRRTSLPEAYLSPPQSLSPRLKGYEQVPPPYWYNDLDNTLPPIDPAVSDTIENPTLVEGGPFLTHETLAIRLRDFPPPMAQ